MYHLIHTESEFGELLSILFVSDDEEEWGMDREELDENIARVYVENLSIPCFSEFGSIKIKMVNGCLHRIL